MTGRETKQWMRCAAWGLAMVLSGTGAVAQAAPTANEDATQTFYLANVTQINDANEILTAMRNLLEPRDKVYYVPSQNAILISGRPDQLKMARRLLDDLDRPKKTYRLTFTTDELDGGKVVGTQHFAMVVVSGGRTTTKVGSKVPVVTGSYDATKGAEKQVTYLDVGLNVDASLDESSQGLRLRTKVERLSVAPEQVASLGADDPVIRQAQIEGTANLIPGKPLELGSLDIPGSTRHVTVSVVVEAVR